MAKAKKEESVIMNNDTAETQQTPEEFLSSFKEKNNGAEPGFSDWYSFREGYNKSNDLGDVTFKQWYSFRRYSIDQTKPYHPEWSVLGSKKIKCAMHDLSCESPEQEYKKLLNEHLNKEA